MILVIAPQKAEQNLRLHVMKDQQLIFNTNMGNLENVLITNSMNFPVCTMNDLLINY